VTEVDRRRALSFGSGAELYDRRRPSYPAAAVDHVLGCVPDAAEVLEIGAGTGKATALLAARGVRVTAVEPDPLMADVLRGNAPAAEVVVSGFEEWPGPASGRGFDLAVSAQAWHWIDHDVAIPRLARLLRPGGAMAVMANIPRDGGFDLHAELEPVYQRFVPDMPPDPMRWWSGEWEFTAAGFRDSGLFDVDDLWRVDWEEPLTSNEFAELTATHSTYRVLDEERRVALVDALCAAIDDRGGRVVMWYRTAVLVARLAR